MRPTIFIAKTILALAVLVCFIAFGYLSITMRAESVNKLQRGEELTPFESMFLPGR